MAMKSTLLMCRERVQESSEGYPIVVRCLLSSGPKYANEKGGRGAFMWANLAVVPEHV